MKPVIGAAAFLGAALGFAGLKFRETRSFLDSGWTGANLILTGVVAALLGFGVLIGFANPCVVGGLPEATVKVDGREIANLPTNTANASVPQSWLRNNYATPLLLRWEPHDIEVSKKWYVSADEWKTAHTAHIELKLHWAALRCFWWPSGMLQGWAFQSKLVPRFRLSSDARTKSAEPSPTPTATAGPTSTTMVTSIPTHTAKTTSIPSGISTPRLGASAAPRLPPGNETLLFDDLLKNVVIWLQDELASHLGQTTTGEDTRPYVIEIAAAKTAEAQESIETAFRLVWHKRDATGQIVKVYQDIVSSKVSVPDENISPLAAASAEIFNEILRELGMTRIKPPVLPLEEIKKNLRLVRESASRPNRALAENAEAAGKALTDATAELKALTATPAAQTATTQAFRELVQNTVKITTQALNSNRVDESKQLVGKLSDFATAATTAGHPELATAAKQGLEQIPKGDEQVGYSVEKATEAINTAEAKLPPRVYLHIASETQRDGARALQNALEEAHFVVPGIQNVAGRGYIPDTTEVRRFQHDEATKKKASILVKCVQDRFSGKARISFVYPDASSDRPGHFEIWFSREAASKSP